MNLFWLFGNGLVTLIYRNYFGCWNSRSFLMNSFSFIMYNDMSNISLRNTQSNNFFWIIFLLIVLLYKWLASLIIHFLNTFLDNASAFLKHFTENWVEIVILLIFLKRESLDLEEFEYEDPTAQSQTGKNL